MGWCSPTLTPTGCSSCSAPWSSRRSPSTVGARARSDWGGSAVDLSIDHVSKSFPGVRALDDIAFHVRAGEIHALMGENGAGKSTLIKIVPGVYMPDSGRLLLDGRPVEFASPRDALLSAIGAVHQERNLIPRFSVGENIILEHLPTRSAMVDYAEVHRQARVVLDLLDRTVDTRAEVATLSVAQMQIVEIAKALSLEAKILLLDEPTASITAHFAAAWPDQGRGAPPSSPSATSYKRCSHSATG